jgi:hypothetical protein
MESNNLRMRLVSLRDSLGNSYASDFSMSRVNDYLKVMDKGTTVSFLLVNEEEEEPNLRY